MKIVKDTIIVPIVKPFGNTLTSFWVYVFAAKTFDDLLHISMQACTYTCIDVHTIYIIHTTYSIGTTKCLNVSPLHARVYLSTVVLGCHCMV